MKEVKPLWLYSDFVSSMKQIRLNWFTSISLWLFKKNSSYQTHSNWLNNKNQNLEMNVNNVRKKLAINVQFYRKHWSASIKFWKLNKFLNFWINSKMFVGVIRSNMISWRFKSYLNIFSYVFLYGKKTNSRKEQMDQMRIEQTISLY